METEQKTGIVQWFKDYRLAIGLTLLSFASDIVQLFDFFSENLKVHIMDTAHFDWFGIIVKLLMVIIFWKIIYDQKQIDKGLTMTAKFAVGQVQKQRAAMYALIYRNDLIMKQTGTGYDRNKEKEWVKMATHEDFPNLTLIEMNDIMKHFYGDESNRTT